MKKKRLLRWSALAMALAAAVFVAAALNHPQWGTALEIGGLRIGAPVWRVCYVLYLAAMCGLLGASFLKRSGTNQRKHTVGAEMPALQEK